jgi:hypothetical protein
MPEGRFVSKSISQNEELARVSFKADYLFGRCIPHLDRDGRMAGNPALVKSITCPLREEIQAEDIPELLTELAMADFVIWYEVDGKQLLEFPRFKVHQKGMKHDREAASRFPPSTSKKAQDLVRSNSGAEADEVPLSRSEVKRSEVEELHTGDPVSTSVEKPQRLTRREAERMSG